MSTDRLAGTVIGVLAAANLAVCAGCIGLYDNLMTGHIMHIVQEYEGRQDCLIQDDVIVCGDQVVMRKEEGTPWWKRVERP